MNDNGNAAAPAMAPAQDSLTILREVSHVYESMKTIRKQAARLAKDGNHSYQALADAMGTTRSAAHQLLNRDAA
jgi:hypothetical protein